MSELPPPPASGSFVTAGLFGTAVLGLIWAVASLEPEPSPPPVPPVKTPPANAALSPSTPPLLDLEPVPRDR